MKRLLQEINWFLRQKIYVAALCLTAVCGYGFAITHYSIGIDDTAVELYLKDGLAVMVGRWTMYLLNKLFYFGEFAPFLTEIAGVFFLMLAATLFAILMRRVSGEQEGIAICAVFACVFVSNPVISMVFTYYYHNGVGIGYVFAALALLCYHGGVTENKGRGKLLSLLGSMLCIWVAGGCYESFFILYILGILTIVFLQGIYDKVKLNAVYVLSRLGIGAALLLGSMVLRSLICFLIAACFQIAIPGNEVALRSPLGGLDLFQSSEGWAELLMLVKRFWLVYHVNALVYLPISIYELACICMGLYTVVAAVRKKNAWYPVLFAGMLVTPFLLTLAGASVTLYRSCQYLPFFAALSVLMLYRAFGQWKKRRYWRYFILSLGVVIVWNQATMMNRAFYRDYQKYEYTKEVLLRVAYDVEKTYGTDFPVVFTGRCPVPYEFVSDYYAGYGSWQYRAIARITDLVDVHLKEKYFQPRGYCFVGEAQYPFIRWALDAFDGTNREMMAFLRMHGYEFVTVSDEAVLERARQIGDSLPGWPREGSVSLQDGYVLVCFGD